MIVVVWKLKSKVDYRRKMIFNIIFKEKESFFFKLFHCLVWPLHYREIRDVDKTKNVFPSSVIIEELYKIWSVLFSLFWFIRNI